MLAVGDDVVDLGDEHIARSHLRPRFVERVLTPAERLRLERAGEPKACLWLHFAAKEAAYKAVAQVRPPPGFAFQRFHVAEDFSSVAFEELVLSARVERHGDRVHAVAWLGERPQVAEAASLDEVDASAAARAGLCSSAARLLGCAQAELSVVREKAPGSWDGWGPPRLWRAGRAVLSAVSLSHDGRFVSWAVCLPATVPTPSPQ